MTADVISGLSLLGVGVGDILRCRCISQITGIASDDGEARPLGAVLARHCHTSGFLYRCRGDIPVYYCVQLAAVRSSLLGGDTDCRASLMVERRSRKLTREVNFICRSNLNIYILSFIFKFNFNICDLMTGVMTRIGAVL